jgi:hypothetical protein
MIVELSQADTWILIWVVMPGLAVFTDPFRHGRDYCPMITSSQNDGPVWTGSGWDCRREDGECLHGMKNHTFFVLQKGSVRFIIISKQAFF